VYQKLFELNIAPFVEAVLPELPLAGGVSAELTELLLAVGVLPEPLELLPAGGVSSELPELAITGGVLPEMTGAAPVWGMLEEPLAVLLPQLVEMTSIPIEQIAIKALSAFLVIVFITLLIGNNLKTVSFKFRSQRWVNT
jgi:hypothetical protein